MSKKYGWCVNWRTYCMACLPENLIDSSRGDHAYGANGANIVCEKCGKTLGESRQEAKDARLNAMIQTAIKAEQDRIVKEMRKKMELYIHRADRIESSIQMWFSTLSDIIENEEPEEEKKG